MTQPVFIFSLPRSGSTLLQRLLMNHEGVRTLGEPSLLLRLLGDDELAARRSIYWEFLVDIAIDDMKNAWSGYEEAYRAGVRSMMEEIYAGLAQGNPYFIDKTPRYSLIAEEIFKTFPDAKFIVLWRHPLAVAASMCKTADRGFWYPEEHAVDMYPGMLRLDAFTRKHQEQVCVVRYEDLVVDAANQLKIIGKYLGWDRLEDSLDRPLPESSGGRLGDATGVKKFNSVSTNSLRQWESVYSNFYRRGWARKYVKGERAEAMTRYGYDLPESIAQSNFLLGFFEGVRDMIMSAIRKHRRITHPCWLPRSLKHYRSAHGFDASWR